MGGRGHYPQSAGTLALAPRLQGRVRRLPGAASFSSESVGRAVLVPVLVFPVGAQGCCDVVVGIGDLVAGAAVTDLDEHHVPLATIDELMSIAGAGLETRDHARPKPRLACTRDQARL